MRPSRRRPLNLVAHQGVLQDGLWQNAVDRYIPRETVIATGRNVVRLSFVVFARLLNPFDKHKMVRVARLLHTLNCASQAMSRTPETRQTATTHDNKTCA